MNMENFAQVSGLGALGLTDMIISTARNAKAHRKNCEHLAEHVRIIQNLLEKLKSTELMSLPATKEPLDCLEEALGKALDLVESCKDKSYLYMLAMGWSVVYQFRQVQAEIDRYLRLVPLISVVHDIRMQHLEEGLEAQYTLDEEEMEAQNVILKSDLSRKDADILEKSLSRRYPDLEFHEALQEEQEKLHVELQRSRTMNDPEQCRVIEHLIEVTKNVVNVLRSNKVTKLVVIELTYLISRRISNNSKACPENHQGQSEWKNDLFGCCSEPCLGLKTCIYPCGTFSGMANIVTKGKISQERAINNLMAYSLFCGCCCYTCCIRAKLRKQFNIKGGLCDDFLTYLLCCCCAMVQEWRELEIGGSEGCQGRHMITPPHQYMKP